MRRGLPTVALGAVFLGCAERVVRPAGTVPADLQLSLLKLPRVWVAGFAIHGRPEFDLNAEA